MYKLQSRANSYVTLYIRFVSIDVASTCFWNNAGVFHGSYDKTKVRPEQKVN